MLYNLIITPIESIVGWIFFYLTSRYPFLGPAGAIIGVSLAINFLALPLYNIADSLQEKERKIQKSLEYRVKRIKKAFKGDEQFMMLQTYYRQNNYHPLYALRSSLSILIEIPFFIAAYHYLSHCEALHGVSFLFMKDLGLPDRIFSINLGSYIFYINILPIIMTAINIISGAVYSKEAPVREKIQIYVLAAIFLVLLYNSPSGLVFYWILNNLFSLFKNIVKKLPAPGKVLYGIIAALLILFTAFFLYVKPNSSLKKKVLLIGISVIYLVFPILHKQFIRIKQKLLKKETKSINAESNNKSQFFVFISSCSVIALLCGLVLPSSVIASSPIEFSFLGNTASPMSYVFSSICVFLGLLLLWPLIIYKLFGNKTKTVLTYAFFTASIISLIDVYILKSSYGEINAFFILPDIHGLEDIKTVFCIIPVITIIACIFLYYILHRYNKEFIIIIALSSICFSEITIGILKCRTIVDVYTKYASNRMEAQDNLLESKIAPYYHLSKDKKNVVVLFLDRAVNSYFARAINDYPEIKNDYEGFVYYPNTISFGTGTDSGGPGLMGGYEYTPYQMNLRDNEPLVNEHNEATLLMPKIFLDAGYKVTVTNPPWPNYSWKGDLSAFTNYPEIKVAELGSRYSYIYSLEKGVNLFNEPDKKCRENIRNFAIMQCLMPFMRQFFYEWFYSEDFIYDELIDDISQLYYLPEITDFESDSNTYTFIDNETTHNRSVMQEPDFEIPAENQNGYSFYIPQYHTNITAYKMIARWLNYLRENNCYDNTRIIIVSDHSKNNYIKEFEAFEEISTVPEHVNCVLLYKDFNSNAPLQIDNSFMTNADTVFLAKEGLDVSDINPFTGKKLTQEKEGGVLIFDTIDTPMDHIKTQFKIDYENVFMFDGVDVKSPDSWKRVELE